MLKDLKNLLFTFALLGAFACDQSSQSGTGFRDSNTEVEEPATIDRDDKQIAGGDSFDPAEDKDLVTQAVGKVESAPLKLSKREIVLLVDGSDSTITMRKELLQNLSNFLSNISLDVDATVHLVGSWALDVPDIPNEVRKYNVTIDSGKLLTVGMDMISSEKLELRYKVPVDLVVVTEDDDALSSQSFLNFVNHHSSDIHLHGAIGLVSSSCGIAAPGYTFLDINKNSENQGQLVDICSKKWSEILHKISELIRQLAMYRYIKLKNIPARASSIKLILDGTEISRDRWEFDKSINSVKLEKGISGSNLKIVFSRK